MPNKWGAVLRGHEFDQQDWRDMLKPPFDPWVEVHGQDTILRSNSLDDAMSAIEVRDRFSAHIDRLNGAMLIAKQSQPLSCGSVVEFAQDGKINQTIFMKGLAPGRSKVGAMAIKLVDGKPEPELLPHASDVQNWAAIADNDDLLEDALIYFGRTSGSDAGQYPPTFWFDIYKALECLMERSGGEPKFLKLDWAPRNAIKKVKQTANWSRHARRKNERPSPASSEQEARELVARLLRRAFDGGG
ncbi:hypothetical protein [Bradyrhizobium sp. DOA9]|uniref:hypothetical protein n=1 Tax=Bradyrhizobium sp. DOA9 TaxID=1126627 RepID=UPI000469F5DE|nr:hypothetical protein [Bradyrhizobium sp. DOA9]GAJ35238.1 hypothetical protein BDOA9_0144390 [Bradyrhizobium sp. DOA9]